MNSEVMTRGRAAYAVRCFLKDPHVLSLKGKKREEWIQNAGMARVAVTRFFGLKPRRFLGKR